MIQTTKTKPVSENLHIITQTFLPTLDKLTKLEIYKRFSKTFFAMIAWLSYSLYFTYKTMVSIIHERGGVCLLNYDTSAMDQVLQWVFPLM